VAKNSADLQISAMYRSCVNYRYIIYVLGLRVLYQSSAT